MIATPSFARAFTLSGTSVTLNRMGYGAMQVAGPQVWGPPRDIDVAIAVLREAESLAEIVCVQNFYNVAHRDDDGFIDDLGVRGIAYVPFFPLGGFSPLQSSALDRSARALNATPMQVALAWLLQRARNILLIPGTSSLEHLRLNIQAAALKLSTEVVADLDAIGRVQGG